MPDDSRHESHPTDMGKPSKAALGSCLTQPSNSPKMAAHHPTDMGDTLGMVSGLQSGLQVALPSSQSLQLIADTLRLFLQDLGPKHPNSRPLVEEL
jgi:hypothetical protein